MYNDGFVVAIKVGDRFVEEKSGNFIVPFSSEYSVRIKNRNNRKAVVRVYIDGEEVNKLGSFILDSNSTLDLERFVDELAVGSKFKFVPLSNSKVKDKNNGENGIIEARFQLVAPVEKPILYNEHHYHTYPHYNTWPGWNVPMCTYTNGKGMSTGGDVNLSMNCCADTGGAEPLMADCTMEDTGGATVQGGKSGQKFSYSYIGELETKETVVRVHLVGSSNTELKDYYDKKHCSNCGKKYGVGDMFCSDCGDKR